jgi:hypothetical protein
MTSLSQLIEKRDSLRAIIATAEADKRADQNRLVSVKRSLAGIEAAIKKQQKSEKAGEL